MTPRTDKRAFWARTQGPLGGEPKPEHAADIKAVDGPLGPAVDWYVVTVAVARELETELAEVKAEIERLKNG